MLFKFSSLRESLRTRESKLHPIKFKQVLEWTINKFCTIVTLKILDSSFKLCLNESVEGFTYRVSLRFFSDGKSPQEFTNQDIVYSNNGLTNLELVMSKDHYELYQRGKHQKT